MGKAISSSRNVRPAAAGKFKRLVRSYYRQHKRALPWRSTRDPYAILVSEVMLQQTQVERVIPYYDRWLREFPDFETLAEAPLHKVLAAWQGLGYNRRGIALHRLSKDILEKYDGVLPRSCEALISLPGIGAYTAAAILAFAFDEPVIMIETNIRRAYLHHFFPRQKTVDDTRLIPFIEATLDRSDPREWYYALMDYGAYLGKTLRDANPNRRGKRYRKQSAFHGSTRELRGKILKKLLEKPLPTKTLPALMVDTPERVRNALTTLKEEGFISVIRGRATLAA